MILSVNQQRVITSRICKMFGVRYKFVDSRRVDEGWARLSQNRVCLPKRDRDINTLVSVVLHEVVHIMAKRQGKYSHFHSSSADNWTIEDFMVYKRTAMFAEMYVDQRAEKLAKMYFPQIQYVQSYREPESRKHAQKGYNEWANQHIAWLKYQSQQKVASSKSR